MQETLGDSGRKLTHLIPKKIGFSKDKEKKNLNIEEPLQRGGEGYLCDLKVWENVGLAIIVPKLYGIVRPWL